MRHKSVKKSRKFEPNKDFMLNKYSYRVTVSQHLWTQSIVNLLRNSHFRKPCALLI